MSWALVSLDAAAAQPWRNGGGVTRELLAWPQAADWRLRISVADVRAAGPFSRFDGIERWFAVLEGAGVVLRLEGRQQRLTDADAPFCFDGGAKVDCALLADATRDFNLMAPPGCARLQRVRGEERIAAASGSLLCVYAHAHPAHVDMDGATLQVPARHLAWQLLPVAASGSVRGDHALWMEVQA